MSRLPRPCVGARLADGRYEQCGAPTRDPSSRCARHRSLHEASRRPSPSVRGYDRPYQADRRALLAERPVCELRLPGCTYWATTADHPVPLAAGGDRRQALVSACSHCNSAKGARLAQS